MIGSAKVYISASHEFYTYKEALLKISGPKLISNLRFYVLKFVKLHKIANWRKPPLKVKIQQHK